MAITCIKKHDKNQSVQSTVKISFKLSLGKKLSYSLLSITVRAKAPMRKTLSGILEELITTF